MRNDLRLSSTCWSQSIDTQILRAVLRDAVVAEPVAEPVAAPVAMQLLLRTRACVRAKGRSYASTKEKILANTFTGTKIQILFLVQGYKH